MRLAGKDIVLLEEQGLMAARVDEAQAASLFRVNGVQAFPSGDGTATVVMPWSDESCRLLNNVGMDAMIASPFFYEDHPKVEGKYNAMTHQLITAAFMVLNPRGYILSDPRTGKTGSIILAMDYLQRMRYVTGAFLIVTTVTTIWSVWKESIERTLPHARVIVANGKTRESALEQDADFIVTNYDSIRISGKAFIAAAEKGRIGACVIDELTHVGNPSSQRHKAIDKLVNGCNMQYVIGATGSPGNNPEAVFGMCRMINRIKLPCTTKRGWLERTTFQWGPEPYMRRLRTDAPEVMHNAMQPAIRFNKSDIIDLPPITYRDMKCVMSGEQDSMREQFKEDAIALARSGEKITAANGGVLASKLLQVAQGICIDNDHQIIELDCKDRHNTLKEIIEETPNKVVVFCCFKGVLAMREKFLKSVGITVERIDGDVAAGKRADILRRFQYEDEPKVLLAHPVTTSFGVELSRADTMVFDGPPMLGGFVYAQALERLSSAKQKAANINVVNIIASPEERRGFSLLASGHDMGMFIASLFEEYK